MALAGLAALSLVLGSRQLGGFQPLELKFYDFMVQRQSGSAPDPRLLIVEITEADLRQLHARRPLTKRSPRRSQFCSAISPASLG
ncbi:MAG: CHASE2 domain-containing protein [Leptolyngbyaceae cyanobacterium SL_1_1]|nr:CHASE2 domain-containing protein [Leptolyngbyaceae cyanobacterium SL_1_1]